ncbi:MAG TPA: hypothetical protein VIY73_12895 [Polyangiaceae bacterium]
MRFSWAACGLGIGVVAVLSIGGCGTPFAASSGGGDGGSGGGNGDGAANADGSGGEGGTIAGEAGTTGDASTAADGASEAAPKDGASSAGDAGVPCGSATTCSGTTPVCCFASSGPSCAHLECGCNVQLDCASDADCPVAALGLCCVGSTQDATCTNGHPHARCMAQCSGGTKEMCDPAAPTCSNGSCSTDTSDLQNVGLPAGPYGICK